LKNKERKKMRNHKNSGKNFIYNWRCGFFQGYAVDKRELRMPGPVLEKIGLKSVTVN
jgi:hypothetical protein